MGTQGVREQFGRRWVRNRHYLYSVNFGRKPLLTTKAYKKKSHGPTVIILMHVLTFKCLIYINRRSVCVCGSSVYKLFSLLIKGVHESLWLRKRDKRWRKVDDDCFTWTCTCMTYPVFECFYMYHLVQVHCKVDRICYEIWWNIHHLFTYSEIYW